MSATAREEGVLKLVHPGRRVEIHREPISAAEVMKKKPRYSVTRPDVFEFPRVVRPETVLFPGEVYLIVPNHTIYKLIKQYKTGNRSSSQKSTVEVNPKHESHEQDSDKEVFSKQSSQESTVEVNPKHQSHQSSQKSTVEVNPKHRSHKQDSDKKVFSKQSSQKSIVEDNPRHQNQQSSQKSTVEVNPRHQSHKQDLDKKVKRQSQVGCWPEDHRIAIEKDRNHRIAIVGTTRNGDKSEALVVHGDVECKSRDQVVGLRSCLRKHGSAGKLHDHRRVSFVLPNEDEEEKKRVTDYQT